MLKFVPIAAAALMSMSAYAVQKDITVTANIDTTLEMLSADGSALPATVQMQYLPGSGLQATEVNTKIFTNDKAKDLQIRLAAEPSMKNQTNPGAPGNSAVRQSGQHRAEHHGSNAEGFGDLHRRTGARLERARAVDQAEESRSPDGVG